MPVRFLTPLEGGFIEDAACADSAGDAERFRDPNQQAMARSLIISRWAAFPSFVDEIHQMIDHPPYFSLVKNVPLDASNLFFVALASSFGELVEPYQQEWSKLIATIRPQTDRVRLGYGVLNEYLHTDGTDWTRPNDLTCLLCLSPDQNGGGRTRLLSSVQLSDDLLRVDEDLLELLSATSVPWLLADTFGAQVIYRPIFSGRGVRWLKFTIDVAVAAGASLPARAKDAVGRLDNALASVCRPLEFLLESGDLLLINNRKCLHARTSITDTERSTRAISRVKVRRRSSPPSEGLAGVRSYRS